MLPSLSTLAAAVVSVESQLSCSAASVGPTGATAEPAAGVLLLEAGGVVPPACSDGVSDSEVAFVHWRAFFYRAKEYRVGDALLKNSIVCRHNVHCQIQQCKEDFKKIKTSRHCLGKKVELFRSYWYKYLVISQ